MPENDPDWDKPAAMAIPKEGYFELKRGRYGPVFPKTPANYGVTIIAKVKPGHEDAIRAVGPQIQAAVTAHPSALALLKLHYLRTILFDVGSGLHFQYQAIFDTELDKYLEDALAFFTSTGTETAFAHLEGWKEDWQTNLPSLIAWMRAHNFPSFLEYGEYPYVTADEVKKGLRLKAAFSDMLDQMQ